MKYKKDKYINDKILDLIHMTSIGYNEMKEMLKSYEVNE